jgi:hypothetical protein
MSVDRKGVTSAVGMGSAGTNVTSPAGDRRREEENEYDYRRRCAAKERGIYAALTRGLHATRRLIRAFGGEGRSARTT